VPQAKIATNVKIRVIQNLSKLANLAVSAYSFFFPRFRPFLGDTRDAHQSKKQQLPFRLFKKKTSNMTYFFLYRGIGPSTVVTVVASTALASGVPVGKRLRRREPGVPVSRTEVL
jgi:hypothetical protein